MAMNRHIGFLVAVILSTCSALNAFDFTNGFLEGTRGQSPDGSTVVRTSGSQSIRWSGVFIPDSRIRELKQAIAAKREPAWSAFQALRKDAENNLTRKPHVPEIWHVPGFYQNSEGHQKAKEGLMEDANAAYGLALYYRISGEKKYANSALRIINAWTGLTEMSKRDDSTLSFCYHFPAMIYAADLLRDQGVWPDREEKRFADFLRNKALKMNENMGAQNNWGNWELLLTVSCAAYLKDEALFKKCVERWKYYVEHQIAEDGRLPLEVRRGDRGIWYTHFCLMPQTLAAEVLKLNGVDLFNYTSPSGRTLKQAFFRIAPWTDKPETYPYFKGPQADIRGVKYCCYFEILNNHWPNATASKLLAQYRPVIAIHSAPYLTLTHGSASAGRNRSL